MAGRGRYLNFIANNFEYRQNQCVLKSLPTSASLNVTNVCNYRCKFCEIHYFYGLANKKSGHVSANHLTVEDLKNNHEWLKCLINLELSGATGEPFANPHFMEIVKYLKTKYPKLILSATTNGALISQSHIEHLVQFKFDQLLFSIHGGDVASYRELQGGDLNKIINTIKSIADYKKIKKSVYPRLVINFALNKLNAATIFNLIDQLVGLDAEYLMIQHYYDSRNAFRGIKSVEDVSFYFNPQEGNKILDKIYAYAAEKGVKLRPTAPLYLDVNDNGEDDKSSERCRFPWSIFKVKGCVEEDESAYVSICNRILLFKINYKKFFENGGTFNDIWNHDIVQFFRKTAGRNSICQFCMNPGNNQVRCLDNAQYSVLRDEAVRTFFQEFSRQYPIGKTMAGLEVLDKNPYEFSN